MPAPVDLKEFVAGFLVEADEHLHSVNRNLVAVADALKRGRPEPRAVRELFRSLHTIKGLASMVGAEPVVDLSHEMEGLLREADRAGGRLSEHALDLLLKATRGLEERVHAISKQGVSGIARAPAQLLEALALAQSTPAQAGAAQNLELTLPAEIHQSLSVADREQVVQAEQTGHRVVLLEFQPSPDKAARGLNITSARTQLARLGELVKVVPRSSPTAPTGIAFFLLLVTNAEDGALAEAIGAPPDAVQAVRISSAEAAPEPVAAATHSEPEPESIAETLPVDHSIRVEVRRLDDALEQLSALIVNRFKLARAAADLRDAGADTRELEAVIAETTRQLRRLRAAMTKARMVFLSELLQRLPLVVRGLTRDTGKTVNLSIHSGSAEVDKAVADKIFPAVVHLVRNAVDHALEPRDERRAAGKPESGTLSVHCDDSSGTNLVLTVRDDGRGIDRERVAKKLGVEVAASDEELLRQITTPGLSTRDDITHTSGRGMGMDIVKRSVETLGGALLLQTEPGRGTTFTLRVPVSVTIVDVFSFVSGGQVFVTPVAMVDEIIEVDPERHVKTPAPEGRGAEPRLVQRRGAAIPLFALDALLEQQPDTTVSPKALVIAQLGGAVAFGVDRMLGRQEAVVRPLDDLLVRVPGVTGATDLGDGKPTLVLDLTTLGAAALQGVAVTA